MKVRYVFWASVLFTAITLFVGCKSSSEPTPLFDGSDYLEVSSPIEYDAQDFETIPNNPFFDLKVPTYITKYKDYYFIVDCYNNQVIYNENLEDPLCEWSVMTSDINMGHTIASDGEVYLIDDTENHRILVMEESSNSNGDTIFVPTQEFNNIGTRPHYIVYDEATTTFYVWSSMTGQMYLMRHIPGEHTMYLTDVLTVEGLNGYYVRSFTIDGDDIYFVSGNGSIIRAAKSTLKVEESYPLPIELAGMVQVTKIEDYWYITISTDGHGNQDAATMIRTKKFEDLAAGKYEDVYFNFIGGGTPYCITKIDEDYYLCEHRIPGHSIWRFDVTNNEITNVETIY